MEKLVIKSIDDVVITKVTSFAVYFKYEGVHYFIHKDDNDGAHSISLYKRIIPDKGHFKLEGIGYTPIASISTFISFGSVPGGRSRKGKELKYFDKINFIKQLAAYKLCDVELDDKENM